MEIAFTLKRFKQYMLLLTASGLQGAKAGEALRKKLIKQLNKEDKA